MEAKKAKNQKDNQSGNNADAYQHLLNVRDADGHRQGKLAGGSDSSATINFIESNLTQTKKKKDDLQALQEKVMLRQEDYWVGSTTTSKANATAGRNTAAAWNTGTKDLSRFRDRVEYPVSEGSDEGRDNDRAAFQRQMEESQLSANQIQKKKNHIIDQYNTLKMQKNTEIGEMARYERDSEKSGEDEKSEVTGGLYSKVSTKLKREALKGRLPRGAVPQSVTHNSDGSLPAGCVDGIVKTCLQDPEIARREQKVKAMKLQDERELLEKEQIFLDEEAEEAVSRQKSKVSKSTLLRAQIAQEQAENVKEETTPRQRIEKDVSKWAGTGLEDMVKGLEKQESSDRKVQPYQDPIEKKKSKKKQKKEQKKKQAAEASAAESQAATQRMIIAEQVPSDTHSDKSSQQQQQYSLFPKSNTNILPQSQPKMIYNLGGPLLINKNFDVCQGHQYFGFGVHNDVHEAVTGQRRQDNSSQKQKSREQPAYQKQKDGSKKQIVSASKFYTLKESKSLQCHYSKNSDRVLPWKQGQAADISKELPRVYNHGASEVTDATFHGSGPAGRRAAMNFAGSQAASGRASIGKGPNRTGTAANEASIPSVKEWFSQLSLAERVLCMTTVDANITSSINSMFKQLRTVSAHDDHAKFRLVTSSQTLSIEVTDRTQKGTKQTDRDGTNGQCTWSMVMCNKNAHMSSSEKKEAESKLLSYIRITDTAQMHDTLTVKEELLKDPEYFYKLALAIVGSNYLKCPHEINWLEEKSAFQSKQPPWFEMWQPNSLAAWILYYLERAMCIQYEHNIYGQFQPPQFKPSKKDLIFLSADKQFIGDEMRPSWRTFCAEVAGDAYSQQLQQFLEMLKNQALQKFGVVSSSGKAAGDRAEVNKFHGGIDIPGYIPMENSHTAQFIDDYVDRVKRYIINQTKEGTAANSNKLDLSELCMDQLLSTSAIVDNARKSLPEIAEVYNVNCSNQHSPEATAAVARHDGQHPALHDTYQRNEYHVAKIHMEMRLERLMAETFKEFRNQRLLSGHESKNKKLQKKKLKKKLQKEQEEERQRQREEQQKKEEEELAKQKSQALTSAGVTASPDDRIKVNNSAAVQLLLGSQGKSPTAPELRKKSAQREDKGDKELAGHGAAVGAASKPQQPVDPFNYFQVFDQQQPKHAALLSHCDVTTKTKSTCAESKQIEQKVAANLTQKQHQELEMAMSNQDILILQQRTSSSNDAEGESMEKGRGHPGEGNAKYSNRDWQRKNNGKSIKVMDEIIGELMSESSSVGKQRNENASNIKIIGLAVKDNKMHAHESHLGTDNEISEDCVNDDAQSSYSSKKDTNRMIVFKKKHHRDVKPHKMQHSPSSSNGDDYSRQSSSSDQDLLPDVYAQFDPQPDDNDSSDYGAEPLLATAEDEEAKSLADDGSSSMVYEKSMDNPSSIQTGSALKKAAKFSDKKSIHTAHPKIEGGRQLVVSHLDKGCSKKQGKRRKIDFYEHGEQQQRQADEVDEDVPQAMITRRKPIKLPIIPTCTIQQIEVEKQQQTSGEVKPDPKSKKKSKKQRQLEYLNYINEKQSSPEQPAKAKQIEIIKPEPVAAVHSKKKKNVAELPKDSGQGNEKKKKKKAPAQEDAMNSFILKLQGEPSEPQRHENPTEAPAATLPKKGKKDSFVKQPRHSDVAISSEPPATKTAATTHPDKLGSKTAAHKAKELEKNDSVQAPDEKFWKQLDKKEKDDRQQSHDIEQKESQQEAQNSEVKNKVESSMTKTALTTKSQEFKVQKKNQSQVLAESPRKKAEDKSPMKKVFSSLQEALEYNQHQLQESKSSTLSGHGSKSKKSQVEQTTTNQQPATVGSDKPKASSKGATSAKDHTSDKSQQSSKPKSKKKKRKKHDTKGSLQLQQSWIDNETGQTVYMPGNGLLPNMAAGAEPPFGPQMQGQFGMDGSGMATDGFMPAGQSQSYQQLQQHLQKVSLQMQQQSAAGFNPAFSPPMPQTGTAHPLLGGLAAPNLEQQVKELLFQIQEQYMVQQQMQMAEMQRRQIEEEEMQLKDDCEPCAEDNEERFRRFFEELGEQMMAKVKEIDMLKDSVRKEREGFIKIVEQMVKDTFSNRDGNGYVGIKMFGSMVTDLAIETSDVDLVVTGINTSLVVGAKEIITPKEHVLRIMQKLYDNIVGLRSTGQIQKIKFIREATVPIIKLVADLQVINQMQTEKAKAKAKKEWEEQRAMEESSRATGGDGGKKAGKPKSKWDELTLKELGIEAREIDPRMRYLQVDISIDEQSDCQVEVTRKHGIPVAPTQAGSTDPISTAAGGDPRMGLIGGQMYQTAMPPPALRGHNGIDTIYHIQELQKARKHLRPIVMIIKKIFDETYLSMPFFGGLSSYSLVLMVSAYLKRFDEGNSESLSRNLSGFFHFYGCYFKPHEFYLDGDNLKFEEIKRPFRDPFIVLDPLDRSNNIGRGSFRIKDVQRALVQAFKIISKSCEEYQKLEEPESTLDSGLPQAQCLPKNVLQRLLTEIREQHFQYNVWSDDEI